MKAPLLALTALFVFNINVSCTRTKGPATPDPAPQSTGDLDTANNGSGTVGDVPATSGTVEDPQVVAPANSEILRLTAECKTVAPEKVELNAISIRCKFIKDGKVLTYDELSKDGGVRIPQLGTSVYRSHTLNTNTAAESLTFILDIANETSIENIYTFIKGVDFDLREDRRVGTPILVNLWDLAKDMQGHIELHDYLAPVMPTRCYPLTPADESAYVAIVACDVTRNGVRVKPGEIKAWARILYTNSGRVESLLDESSVQTHTFNLLVKKNAVGQATLSAAEVEFFLKSTTFEMLDRVTFSHSARKTIWELMNP